MQLAVEESLNIIPLDRGAHLLLSKVEQQTRMSLDVVVDDMGVSYTDESSCSDDLSLSILQGLCDVLTESVDGGQRTIHMELNEERLLLK